MKDKKLLVMMLVFFVFVGGTMALGIHIFSGAVAIAITVLLSVMLMWIMVPRGMKYWLTKPWLRIPMDLFMTLAVPAGLGLSGSITGMLGAILFGVVFTLIMKAEYHRLRMPVRRGMWTQ